MRVAVAAALLAITACTPSDRALESRLAAAQALFDSDKFSEAMEAARKGSAAAGAGTVVRSRFQLLEAKAAAYASPERVAQLLPAASSDFPAIDIERRIVLANARLWERDTAQAEGLLQSAMRDADAAGDIRLSLDARMAEVRRLDMSGKSAEADRLLLDVLARARKAGIERSAVAALANLGFLRLRHARYAEAIPFLEQAIQLTRARKNTIYFNSLNNLGICLARLGEFDQAVGYQTEAIAGFEAKGAREGLMQAVSEAAASHYYRGSLGDAIGLLERAYQLAQPAGGENAARIATNLATLQADRGNWARAAELNDQALELKRRMGSPSLVHNILNAAQIAAGRGEGAEARRLYQQAVAERTDQAASWRALLGLAQLARKDNDVAAARRHFEAAIQAAEASRSELEKADLRLSYFASLIDFYQRYVEFLMEQGDAAMALEVAESSRAKVLLERTGARSTARLPADAYKKLAAESQSVILSFWLSPRASYLWVVTPAAIHSVTLPNREQLSAWVSQYSAAILNQADPVLHRVDAGDQLYRALVAPAMRWIPSSSPVVLVLDGALHNLNFETLPVSGGERAHYWIEDVEISVAPSLAAAVARPAALRRSLLLVGDPVSADARYPRLKNAAREMENVSSHFPPQSRWMHVGDQATPAAFLAAKPGQASHIHFTAHAIANRQAPLDSAIVLSGGMLYARDLLKLDLQAELVAVSACRGAGGRAYMGEGLVGFAWAFLRAGAARVIAGLWDVDDSATADLMGALYEGIRNGKAPASALRQAKLSLLRGKHAKPYYWGPFQLFAAMRR